MEEWVNHKGEYEWKLSPLSLSLFLSSPEEGMCVSGLSEDESKQGKEYIPWRNKIKIRPKSRYILFPF